MWSSRIFLYVSTERGANVLTLKHVRGAPDLVVEIGSESTRKRDETIKRRLYERFGVSEYWVVDPELDSIKVYRRVGERYERTAELSLENGDALTTPLMPGCNLPLRCSSRNEETSSAPRRMRDQAVTRVIPPA